MKDAFKQFIDDILNTDFHDHGLIPPRIVIEAQLLRHKFFPETEFDYVDVEIDNDLYVVRYRGKQMKLSEAFCMVQFEDITSVDERGNELITRFWPIGGVKKHTPKKVKFRV